MTTEGNSDDAMLRQSNGEWRSQRILVVDDNVDSAELLEISLELRGHIVEAAYDARSALEAIESFAPDVVLLDIGLPDLDGYELAIRLREHPNARGARLIAVTGWGQSRDVARASEHGIDAHLIKPFDMNVLFDLISRSPRRGNEPGQA